MAHTSQSAALFWGVAGTSGAEGEGLPAFRTATSRSTPSTSWGPPCCISGSAQLLCGVGGTLAHDASFSPCPVLSRTVHCAQHLQKGSSRTQASSTAFGSSSVKKCSKGVRTCQTDSRLFGDARSGF
jgi:hypothetical protein